MFKPKTIKLATQGVSRDFQASLFPAIVRSLGYEPVWSNVSTSDLMIVGPFLIEKKSFNWVPKPLRPFVFNAKNGIENNQSKRNKPPKIFITGENVRHDFQNCDFAISFDLGISSPHHFRMPYWMEVVDWSQEGVVGNINPRYGRLLNLERLMQPLGNEFLSRPQKAAIFASHLREPRRTLLNALKKQVEVIEYGRSFNQNVKNHLESGIIKYEELRKIAFNLCPENGMYPGYYTEKIPEAFMAGCLPISWADENVRVDFNPKAFINLAPMYLNNFAELEELLQSKKLLKEYTEQPLLSAKLSIEPLRNFVKNIIHQVLS